MTPAYITLSDVAVSDANGAATELKANTAYTLTAKMASTFETKTPVMVVIAEKDASLRLVKFHYEPHIALSRSPREPRACNIAAAPGIGRCT